VQQISIIYSNLLLKKKEKSISKIMENGKKMSRLRYFINKKKMHIKINCMLTSK